MEFHKRSIRAKGSYFCLTTQQVVSKPKTKQTGIVYFPSQIELSVYLTLKKYLPEEVGIAIHPKIKISQKNFWRPDYILFYKNFNTTNSLNNLGSTNYTYFTDLLTYLDQVYLNLSLNNFKLLLNTPKALPPPMSVTLMSTFGVSPTNQLPIHDYRLNKITLTRLIIEVKGLIDKNFLGKFQQLAQYDPLSAASTVVLAEKDSTFFFGELEPSGDGTLPRRFLKPVVATSVFMHTLKYLNSALPLDTLDLQV